MFPNGLLEVNKIVSARTISQLKFEKCQKIRIVKSICYFEYIHLLLSEDVWFQNPCG